MPTTPVEYQKKAYDLNNQTGSLLKLGWYYLSGIQNEPEKTEDYTSPEKTFQQCLSRELSLPMKVSALRGLAKVEKLRGNQDKAKELTGEADTIGTAYDVTDNWTADKYMPP